MGYKSDIEIAQECVMEPITKIAEKAGIDDKYLEQYGRYKAKIDYNLLKESDAPDGKLVLVTAINPTPAGEGKTTTTVGLADAMQKIGKNVMVALREPSLGPVFGVKGGAAGGGYAVEFCPKRDGRSGRIERVHNDHGTAGCFVAGSRIFGGTNTGSVQAAVWDSGR